MPAYHLKTLNREEYITSINLLEDPKSIGFSNHALKWWDRHFRWQTGGCVVLTDEKAQHLCYIFYKIDRYNEYMTIHNLLTPLKHRRNGYAKTLLKRIFHEANQKRVKRFRATCVPQSLDFYLSLGFAYWGLTLDKDYYCNLPMPKQGLEDLSAMVIRTSSKQLMGDNMQMICTKVKGNEKDLTNVQQDQYDSDREKMESSFMRDALSCITS